MKKKFKYILLILIMIIIPINVNAAVDDSMCGYRYDRFGLVPGSWSGQSIRVKVGESFNISCTHSMNNPKSCMDDGDDNTGFCQNSEKNNLEDDTALFNSNYSNNVYTFTAQNVGYNYFNCDTWGSNSCYLIAVTDENGNTYADLHPSEYESYTASGNFSTTPQEGYGCYYLTSNSLGIDKFVFYTNRDMSGTGALNLFEGTDNIQSIWQNRTNKMYDYSGLEYDMTTFENYRNGDPMSADTCAAAGAVIMKSNGSGWGGGLAGNVSFVEEINSGSAGVYDIFGFADDFSASGTTSATQYSTNNQALILYGNGFVVHDADYSSPDPYNCDWCYSSESELFAVTASRNLLDSRIGQDFREYYDIGTCFDSISSQSDLKTCFGCSGSSIDDPCSKSPNIYTIGVLEEPDTVTNLIQNINDADPNQLVDGHIIGLPDAEAGAYTWTCEDVKHVTFIYTALRIIAPFLLILFGSIDFFKAVIAGDVKKQQEARIKFPKRLIAFLLLLILPFIVHLFFTMFGTHRSNVMTPFCCVATNGNDVCYTNNGNSSSNSTPTNTSQIDEVTSENLCNGSNYLSPTYIETTTAVSTCVNDRYGECISISTSDSMCKCRYTALEIPQELCTRDNCAVGYKGGRCFYNVRKGVSISTINNITTNLTQIKKVHQSGTTGDYYDGYFDYDMHINESIPSSVCTGELNGTPYNCNSNETSCNCIYGNSIY